MGLKNDYQSGITTKILPTSIFGNNCGEETMKRIINVLWISLILVIGIFPPRFLWGEKFLDLIDTPTAGILGYGEYNLNFRIYNGGSILSKAVFGIIEKFNFGFYYDIEGVIGHEVIKGRPPQIFIKFRLFHGMGAFPACALGYDGQGYGQYDEDENKYSEREKGVYFVLSKEILTPGLEFDLGCNIYKFKNATLNDDLYTFCGLAYNVREKVVFLIEYDNIKKTSENRFNAGLRLFTAPNFNVELSGKGLGRASEDIERILRINYVDSF